MPQANITYDAPYNRSMVSMIEELDRKHWERAYPAYHPNPMGFRLGSFHGEPVSQVKVGGGSHPEKYLRSGNSPAYPPLHLSAGLAVNSGGARSHIGVDGAIGLPHPALAGGAFNPFDAGYNFGHDVLGPAIFGKKRGGKLVKIPSLGKALKTAITHPDSLIKSKLGLGRQPKVGGKKFNFLNAIKSVGHAVGEPVGQATQALLAKEALGAVGLGRKTASRGRSARAEIVKKVMKEQGLKMIEASKYVKAHGLY